MSRLTDLAIDIASVPDLAKVPQKVVPINEALTENIEQDAEKIEIDLGDVVISIFHRKATYMVGEMDLNRGWHFLLTTYTHAHEPAGPGLIAEETAIDQIVQYIRQRVQQFGAKNDATVE